MFERYISDGLNFIEIPSFAVAIYTLLLALVLSTVIALTYRFTFQGDNFPNSFFQAIVLSSTVSAMVMMAVGDNLAIGFGVLGAVSIIRFRTLVRNPRNIIFIFSALSVGIASGVFGYAIAVSGTVVFCTAVILLYYSPYGREGDQKYRVLFIAATQDPIERFNEVMASYGSRPTINEIRQAGDEEYRYTFVVGLKTGTDRRSVYADISKIEGIRDVRLEYDAGDERL